jgi:hypothetical protein
MIIESLSISKRFCGPSRSGNGGYVCGRIARHIPGCARVRLFIPPPLESPLSIDAVAQHLRLMAGATVVAEGRPAELDLEPPAAPSFDQAAEASKSYLGFTYHSFPRCFVCGPQRPEGDGMRIFAGPVEGQALVAAPWHVDASLADGSAVPDAFLWAALDCPSAFALLPARPGMTIVLGEMCARIEGRVRPGDRCVAAAWPIRREGRKRIAGSAVFRVSGEIVAVGRSTWIEVPESAFPEETGG